MIEHLESEVSVLAGMLQSEKLLFEGLAIITVNHFQNEDHQAIFESISDLVSEKGTASFSIVYKMLRDRVNSDRLLVIKQTAVAESAFSFWMEQLHESYKRRSYIQAAKEILNIANSDRPIKEVTEIVERKILSVDAREGSEKIFTPEEAGRSAAEEFEKRVNSGERIHGIKLSREVPTGGVPAYDGFPGLDNLFRGLRAKDLIVLAARTGDGKTALAQNIVRHASIHQNYRTFYQNTEMNPDEVVFRFVAAMSGKDFEEIDSGTLNSWDRGMVRQSFENFCNSRIYISHLPMLTPERSRGLARQFKITYGQLDLLVIDYIGRMELQDGKNKQEWQVLRDVAKECKRLAGEMNVCVILISQLTEEGKLQGAKAIANEADGVLYLEPMEKDEYEDAPRGATHKIVAQKARRGSKGTKIWICFNKRKMHMTEVR
jgi:replicative DNA helicase